MTQFLAKALLATTVWAVPAAAQPSAPESGQWTVGRTPWGDPDLQGMWTNETITPFERPPQYKGKAFLTAAEAAKIEQDIAKRRAAGDGKSSPGNVGSYNQIWMDSGDKFLATRQTSLVVEPADGIVPTRDSAVAKRDYNKAHEGDHYKHMSVWDRCITRGVPGSMFPAGYNNAYRIVQIPGYVAIFYEMIHDIRMIPLDGRPHVSENIRLWMGDSRGRWEGDTLVVDVTNFTDKGWIANNGASRRIKGIPQSEKLHVVERFTRTNEDTIRYEVTIEDPEMYTAPWKVSMPLTRDPEYRIYEYACHEGNTAVELILGGARAEEAAGAGQ